MLQGREFSPCLALCSQAVLSALCAFILACFAFHSSYSFCFLRSRKRLEYRRENILPIIPIRVSVSCICSLPYGNTTFVIVVGQTSFTFLSQSQYPDFERLFSSVRVCAHGQFSFSAVFCHLYRNKKLFRNLLPFSSKR